jgi:hypothetical protein
MAEAIAIHSNKTHAASLRTANAEIRNGDLKGQHIGYWTPRRQIKTFHPRSPGMVAYHDAIRDHGKGRAAIVIPWLSGSLAEYSTRIKVCIQSKLVRQTVTSTQTLAVYRLLFNDCSKMTRTS